MGWSGVGILYPAISWAPRGRAPPTSGAASVVLCPSVRPNVCKLFAQITSSTRQNGRIAIKLAHDGLKLAYRVCSRSRSKVT